MGTNRRERYVITGINRLTGLRETISRCYPLKEARRLRDALASRQKRNSAYSRLKVQVYDTQLHLRFE
jgi:hypothetical protein